MGRRLDRGLADGGWLAGGTGGGAGGHGRQAVLSCLIVHL